VKNELSVGGIVWQSLTEFRRNVVSGNG